MLIAVLKQLAIEAGRSALLAAGELVRRALQRQPRAAAESQPLPWSEVERQQRQIDSATSHRERP